MGLLSAATAAETPLFLFAQPGTDGPLRAMQQCCVCCVPLQASSPPAWPTARAVLQVNVMFSMWMAGVQLPGGEGPGLRCEHGTRMLLTKHNLSNSKSK